MIEILYENKWRQFYPILELELCGEGDTIDKRPLAELSDRVYGKWIGGISGYTPWWVFDTVDKIKLREI
jgi:hypothetical protein